MDAIESTELRDDTHSPKLDSGFSSLCERIELDFLALNAKIDSNHATLMWSLRIHKRLGALERSQQPERRAEIASASS
jgi:hypothetical protein